MAKLADLIWKNAELLRGAFKENEYRKVILPFTILRRLDCVLAPSRTAALTVNALPAAGAAFDANAVASAAGLDMADWWEPTADGFLNHVAKAQIVQALKMAGPDLARDGVEGMKKDVLVNTAAARLVGTRWLPTALRPPAS